MTSRAWLGGMARRALAAPLKGRARRFPPAGALDEMKNWPHKPRAAHQLRPFYLLAALAFCTQARVLALLLLNLFSSLGAPATA